MKGVVVLVALCVGIVPLALVLRPFLTQGAQTQKLQASGIMAPATVLSVSDSGNKSNYQPVYDVQVQVSPPGGPAFAARAQMVINAANAAQFQPGQPVTVKYNPSDPDQVLIVPGP